jgi:hypothetical protein
LEVACPVFLECQVVLLLPAALQVVLQAAAVARQVLPGLPRMVLVVAVQVVDR